MKKIYEILALKYEARLFDSKIYIIKSALTMITAYSIAVLNPVLKHDTISILFGAMLTLEPVTLAGLRSGLNQLTASIIGGISTAVIIFIFGINSLTIALAVAFTLYICLKINWREVSPVAIFTAIYMTQYIQKNSSGVPSILLTLRLRFAALGFGILVAVIFNFIFSILSYKSMANKRITYLIGNIISNMKRLKTAISENALQEIQNLKNYLPIVFNNIDWVYNMFEDLKKEKRIRLLFNSSENNICEIQDTILKIRAINHLIYDMCYLLSSRVDEVKLSQDERNMLANIMDLSVYRLAEFQDTVYCGSEYKGITNKDIENVEAFKNSINTNKGLGRLYMDITEIQRIIENF